MLQVARCNNQELSLATGIKGASALMKIRSLKFNTANLYDTMLALLLNHTPEKTRHDLLFN